jgi:hypothetical protein
MSVLARYIQFVLETVPQYNLDQLFPAVASIFMLIATQVYQLRRLCGAVLS